MTIHRHLLATLVILVPVLVADEPRGVDICTLLREPAKWNGAMVEISGIIRLPYKEGDLVIDGSRCDARVIVGDITFENIVPLINPQSSYEMLHKVDFAWPASTELQHFLQTADRRRQQMRATVIGLFETRVPQSGLVNLDALKPAGKVFDLHRPVLRRGFGHLNAAPAQLLLKDIKNMSLVPSDASK